MALESTYASNGSTAIGGAQSYFELPPASGAANTRDNVSAPPTAVVVDFSNPLAVRQLYKRRPVDPVGEPAGGPLTAISATWAKADWAAPDTGFTLLSDYTVTLYNYNPITQTSSVVVPGGSGNRLVLQLDPGNTLPADDYRVYIPNQVEPNGHRHPDLRHLRQPARWRKPGRPDQHCPAPISRRCPIMKTFSRAEFIVRTT